ncbi:gamma-glutamylcyclotransferase [Verrucomicrobia bacterium S94]|nr:gamma-glutamylcyclotransferase [Verrucomicrobia bacterium S94]
MSYMNLFAYGTLMWPEVLESVTGRRIAGTAAVLRGYRRLRVKGEHYPVVVPSSADCVEGVLYCGLTMQEFRLLDDFEGDQYDRIEADIGDDTAFVYVLSSDWKHIADSQRWNPEDLKPEQLAEFCSEYCGWDKIRD